MPAPAGGCSYTPSPCRELPGMPISEVARTCARSTPKHTPVARRSCRPKGVFFALQMMRVVPMQQKQNGSSPGKGAAVENKRPACGRGPRRGALGLVAQTLLVTVLAHALAALVLVDLGLTSLLERTHGYFDDFVVILASGRIAGCIQGADADNGQIFNPNP